MTLVACGGAAAAIPSAAFVATDFAIEGPDSLPAGLTEIRLENQGAELHQIEFVHLDEGKTFADYQAFMSANPTAPAPDFGTLEGGPNAVMPGAAASAYVDLEPGTYVLRCVIPSPDGQVHSAKGMVTTLTVTAAEGPGAKAPEADVTVHGSDFSFKVDGTIEAGDRVINFVNDGTQPHEIVLVRLDEGATAADFAAAFGPDAPPGPPPGAGVGGTVGIEPGASQRFPVHFEPGRYAFLCFFEDPASHAPHFALGMEMEFTVE